MQVPEPVGALQDPPVPVVPPLVDVDVAPPDETGQARPFSQILCELQCRPSAQSCSQKSGREHDCPSVRQSPHTELVQQPDSQSGWYLHDSPFLDLLPQETRHCKATSKPAPMTSFQALKAMTDLDAIDVTLES